MLRLNTETLFSMQKQLDTHIEAEHGLANEDTREQRLLALQVELGELANETRCFKFWSVKPPSDKEVILEEYVDGVHFILSLGLSYGYRPEESNAVEMNERMVDGFLDMFDSISAFRHQPDQARYSHMFFTYLALGKRLGFTAEEIQAAYESKNQTNHERQEQGY